MTTDNQPRPRARGRQTEKAERPTDPPPPGSIADLYRDLLPAVDFVAVQTKIDVALTVRPIQLRNVLATSLQNPKLRMTFLRNLTAVDWEAEGMEVVYHLYSYEHRHGVAIKTLVPSQDAQLPTVSDSGARRIGRNANAEKCLALSSPDTRTRVTSCWTRIWTSTPCAKLIHWRPSISPKALTWPSSRKRTRPHDPAATAGAKGAARVAASDEKAAAAPVQKPAADLTPEEAAARKAEQAERVRKGRALAAARRAEVPPVSSPRPKAADPAANTPAAAATLAAPETAETTSATEEDAPTSATPTAPHAPKAAPAAPDTGADSGDDAADRKASQDERVARARALAAERRAQKREEEGGA